MTRVGPSEPDRVEDDHVRGRGRQQPGVQDGEHDRHDVGGLLTADRTRREQLPQADRRERQGPAQRRPGGQGERRVTSQVPRADRGIQRPAERRREGHREPDRRPGKLDPDAARDDDDDPHERDPDPERPLRRQRVHADRGGDHGGEDGRRCDQQRGVAGRRRLQAHRPEDLVEPEPEGPEQDDPDGVGMRQPERTGLPAEERPGAPSSRRGIGGT